MTSARGWWHFKANVELNSDLARLGLGSNPSMSLVFTRKQFPVLTKLLHVLNASNFMFSLIAAQSQDLPAWPEVQTRMPLAAQLQQTSHVFDVLILNWASNKHQLARLWKESRNYKYPGGRKLSHRKLGLLARAPMHPKQIANSVIKSNCFRAIIRFVYLTLSPGIGLERGRTEVPTHFLICFW